MLIGADYAEFVIIKPTIYSGSRYRTVVTTFAQNFLRRFELTLSIFCYFDYFDFLTTFYLFQLSQPLFLYATKFNAKLYNIYKRLLDFLQQHVIFEMRRAHWANGRAQRFQKGKHTVYRAVVIICYRDPAHVRNIYKILSLESICI